MPRHLLDISRLLSRIGQGQPTGIDRVELAYLRAVLERPEDARFIARIPRAFAVFDKTAAWELLSQLESGAAWKRNTRPEIRQLADKLLLKVQVSHWINKTFSNELVYFNVGHAKLQRSLMAAVKKHRNSNFIVLIHDIIPITHPQFTRSDRVDAAHRRLKQVSQAADFVIYNSSATQLAAETYFKQAGRVPEGRVALLGVDSMFRPQFIDNAGEKPNFCIVGTIEPRKNHQLLLALWQTFCAELSPDRIPTLHIIGRRGWENDRVFNILNEDPVMGLHVFEHNDWSDEQVRSHLAQSWGLLFPSFVEGFGLPLVEAASLGVPVICGDNAIYREILGDYPLYLNVDNSYVWRQRILERAGRNRESIVERQERARSVLLPDWASHFDLIFRLL